MSDAMQEDCFTINHLPPPREKSPAAHPAAHQHCLGEEELGRQGPGQGKAMARQVRPEVESIAQQCIKVAYGIAAPTPHRSLTDGVQVLPTDPTHAFRGSNHLLDLEKVLPKGKDTQEEWRIIGTLNKLEKEIVVTQVAPLPHFLCAHIHAWLHACLRAYACRHTTPLHS